MMQAEQDSLAGQHDNSRNRNATKMSFWQAFVTTFDFQGPSVQEAWHGHHFPWRRTLVCIALCCWTNMISLFTAIILEAYWPQSSPLGLLPILRFMNATTREQVRKSHVDCVKSLQDIFKHDVTFDCLFRDTPAGFVGVGIDYEAYDGPNKLDWPASCKDAYNNTLGRRALNQFSFWEDTSDNGFVSAASKGLTWANVTTMVRISPLEGDESQSDPAFLVVYPNCTMGILVDFIQDITGEEMLNIFDVNQFIIDMKNVTERFNVIPEPERGISRIPSMMWQLISLYLDNDFFREIPFESIHSWIIRHRQGLSFCVASYALTLLYGQRLLETMMRAFVLAIIVRWILPWPRDQIGKNKVTFWSIWNVLIMISTILDGYIPITMFHDDSWVFMLIYDSVIVFAAYKYTNNYRVFHEYAFISIARLLLRNELGFDSWQIPYEEGIFGGSIFSWVAMLIPGYYDSSKLINAYAICRAYPFRRWSTATTETERTDVQVAGVDIAMVHEKIE